MGLAIPLVVAFVGSLLSSVIIVMTQKLHGRLTLDSRVGVQKLHKQNVPRIGGISLLCGAVLGGFWLPGESRMLWWLLLASAVPAFVSGLTDDLTKRVGVKARFLATICSGLIFCLVTDYHIDHIGIPGLDWFFARRLPAILFTAFAIGGVVNAFNIIDGVNGLASGTAIIVLCGFAVVAWSVGDVQILALSILLVGALGGFFLMNFPFGKLFLGDAGAYVSGFLLAALAVALPMRNPALSPLIGLLALSYPVIETIVSIRRRLLRSGSHPGQPDRLHLHSLIYRSLALRLARNLGLPGWRNALTGLIVMALPLAASLLMVAFAGNNPMILAAIGPILMAYLWIYRRVALLRRVQPAHRPIRRRKPAVRPV